MSKEGKTADERNSEITKGQPRSLTIANRGIKTSHDFANMMSAMMSDLIEGKITPSIGNSACNAGGKLLKVVEMQYKYGTAGIKGGGSKKLVLAIEEDETQTASA